jgi:monoamine oxidase
MLTGWLGGPPAQTFSSATPDELLLMALGSLDCIFQRDTTWLMQQLAGWKIKNWAEDPFARGAYSYATVNAAQHIAVLQQPVQGTLYFAGEAINDNATTGTVEAALSSGLNAAAGLTAETEM